jgi:hypothetical protein
MANEADRRAVVKSAMSRAAKLMQLESNGTLDKIASDPNFRKNINTSLNEDVMTGELMTTARDRKKQAPIATRQMGQNASNVPAAIREAFMSNPIDDSALYDTIGGDGRSLSFLDEMVEEKHEIVKPTQNVRQIVNEGIATQQSQMMQPMQQQIDYPMIRTIVEEIVRKYAVSLNKKIISENKQSTPTNTINTIALGETFKFLDNAGNIYEAKLVKKGNIKDKKNVNG